MFDTVSDIIIDQVWTASAGLTDITVHWPADLVWAERFRRRKILSKPMGRGMSETMIESEQADLALYEKCKLEGSPALTTGEAFHLVKILEQFSITDIKLDGTDALVEADTLYGSVTHRMKLLSLDQALELKKSNKVYTLAYGWQDCRVLLEPGAKVYEACGGISEDYTGAIPMLHKNDVARGIQDFLDRQMSPRNDEKHF
jgi:hypothetical protein